MSGRVFVDTNILVYAYVCNDDNDNKNKDEDVKKHHRAKQVLQNTDSRYVISTQVLSEFYVALAKYKIEHDTIASIISEIITFCDVAYVGLETVNYAVELKKQYGYSYWDCLILSSALENKCIKVYSEDMRDGQTIEGSAVIDNIFTLD